MLSEFKLFEGNLDEIDSSKKLITTINAHSFNTLLHDDLFKNALSSSDVLLPDGVSVVWATRLLNGKKIKKIAGADIFYYEMQRINKINGKCFFLGSSENTLKLIRERMEKEYPNLNVYTYSPPYKTEFDEEDNRKMISAVNEVEPDVLFIGMTAPKQEKWSYTHFNQLNAGHVCCIGAVFDFYAGTVKRAPDWIIYAGMEWFYRLIKEPRRLWHRYLVGNTYFIYQVLKEKYQLNHKYKKVRSV